MYGNSRLEDDRDKLMNSQIEYFKGYSRMDGNFPQLVGIEGMSEEGRERR
jgi:hypothetical protein